MNTMKHILIIDDEQHFRYGAAVALRKVGYRVSEAGNGNEAMKMMANSDNGQSIDLILLDIQMPGMMGNELIEEMEGMNLRIPVVIITGYADRDVLSKLYDRGYSDILHKPFAPVDLVNIIKEKFESVC